MGTRASRRGTGRQGSQTSQRRRPAGAAHDYVITVVGEIPRDIAERVSAAHTAAIGANRSRHIPAVSHRNQGRR